MNKVLYCPVCDNFNDVDIFENVDHLTFHCSVCDTVVGAEAYKEGVINSEIVALLSEESRETICTPCICGEGCNPMTVREVKALIADTTEQIIQLTTAASELLAYKEELMELIA